MIALLYIVIAIAVIEALVVAFMAWRNGRPQWITVFSTLYTKGQHIVIDGEHFVVLDVALIDKGCSQIKVKRKFR